MVTSFRYLGGVVTADDDWPVVIRNFSRARAVWKRMARIPSREGVEPRESGFLFKDVAQAVFFFSSETWVVTPCTGRALGGFWDQVARRLMGRLPWRKPDRTWTYNLAVTAREEAGFQINSSTLEHGCTFHRNTITVRTM